MSRSWILIKVISNFLFLNPVKDLINISTIFSAGKIYACCFTPFCTWDQMDCYFMESICLTLSKIYLYKIPLKELKHLNCYSIYWHSWINMDSSYFSAIKNFDFYTAAVKTMDSACQVQWDIFLYLPPQSINYLVTVENHNNQ